MTLLKNTQITRKLFPKKWSETRRQIVKAYNYDPNNFGEMVVKRHPVLAKALRIDCLDYAELFCPGIEDDDSWTNGSFYCLKCEAKFHCFDKCESHEAVCAGQEQH